MSGNSDLEIGNDLGIDLGMGDITKLAAAEKKAAKKAPAAPPKAVIDPEHDRENWPVIHIEMEDGKPNYEYFGSHGTLKNGQPFGHDLQIMRGVDVPVPPSIVYNLRDAIAAHYVPRIDQVTGKQRLERQDRSSIPWRLMKGGKYC